MGMSTGGNPRPTIDCDPLDGQAKQSFKDECDINLIIKKYEASGMVSHLQRNVGVYADVSEVMDYRSAIDRVRGATSVFLGLDPETRAQLGNSTAAFLDLLADPSRRAELDDLGLGSLIEAPEAPEAPSPTPAKPESKEAPEKPPEKPE